LSVIVTPIAPAPSAGDRLSVAQPSDYLGFI